MKVTKLIQKFIKKFPVEDQSPVSRNNKQYLNWGFFRKKNKNDCRCNFSINEILTNAITVFSDDKT